MSNTIDVLTVGDPVSLIFVIGNLKFAADLGQA